MPRVQFTTRLDEKLLKEIKKLAIDLDCSVNDILEYCFKSFLKDPAKHTEIKKQSKRT